MHRKNPMGMLIACGVLAASHVPLGASRAEEPLSPAKSFSSKCLVWFPAPGNPLLVNIWNNCGYCVIAATRWEFADGRVQSKNLNVKAATQITISVGGTASVIQTGERVC